jgi:hypothetical protein
VREVESGYKSGKRQEIEVVAITDMEGLRGRVGGVMVGKTRGIFWCLGLMELMKRYTTFSA